MVKVAKLSMLISPTPAMVPPVHWLLSPVILKAPSSSAVNVPPIKCKLWIVAFPAALMVLPETSKTPSPDVVISPEKL